MFILSDCFKKSRLSQNQKCNHFFPPISYKRRGGRSISPPKVGCLWPQFIWSPQQQQPILLSNLVQFTITGFTTLSSLVL